MTNTPSNNILANNVENVKKTTDQTDNRTTENEKLWDGQAFSEGVSRVGPTPELVSLPTGRILASAPWRIRERDLSQVVGLVLSGPIIVETVFDPETGKARFAVQERGKEPYYAESLKDQEDRVLRPLVDSMVRDGVVLLPSQIGPAMDPSQLLAEIMTFLHRYVGFACFEDVVVAATYTLFTWRFDEFATVPYLRVHGPAGSGKIRCLKTLASIAYRAINVPGGGSHKAMLRLLNKFRGTAVIYYADTRGQSQRACEIAIQLALGSQVDLADIALKQCDRFSDDSWEPMARSLFGPKVLATSQSPLHPLLDSICLTIDLRPTKRTDIPVSLPFFPEWHEAIDLRNKLLKYRLDYARGYPHHQSPTFEQGVPPHLQELVMPLRKVAEDVPALLPMIDNFIGRSDVPHLASTRNSQEVIVLEAVLLRVTRGELCTVGDLAQDLKEQHQVQIDAGKVGLILKALQLPTEKLTSGPKKGCMSINAAGKEIVAACKQVGLAPPHELVAQAARDNHKGEDPTQPEQEQ